MYKMVEAPVEEVQQAAKQSAGSENRSGKVVTPGMFGMPYVADQQRPDSAYRDPNARGAYPEPVIDIKPLLQRAKKWLKKLPFHRESKNPTPETSH